ncbi:Gfo/Idh/MocA family oxidoreductase [Clostridium sp. SYSU_GA19001]|uniref:Gfo/Idh/MocA family protein n=1 Tax=Clostridium caldaquaticum TaxID=2940653 RepID=UPI0020772EE2|nr:Gfo/Idh/MocA family oxidoreductase [Clostridium caldaquaticum]MCM8709837.1 Gfo/Idh/MocA family oxidoreductase [Clostridium caldaquaticum]
MSDKKCKIAIIGYGGMGTWHARQLMTMDEVKLCGIYDISSKRLEAAKKEGIHAYESFEELLADKDIELVTIATPNDLHKELAIKAMQEKKNVICEKPVALSSVELLQMIEASKEYNVIFTVHQNRRWDEDYLVIKKLYEEGTLGKIFNIESRVHGSRGIPGDWRNTKEHGGGMVLDWGVHLFDQILMLIEKKVVSTYANLTNVTNEAVDDGFKIILHFEDGLTCHVEVGTSNFINLPRWYMQGENGTAIINDWNLNGKIIQVSNWEKRDAVPVVTAAGLTKTMAPRTSETIKEYPLPRVQSDVRDFYRNVIRAINGQEEIIVKHSELMRVMKLMETVFHSAEIGQVIHDII